MTASTLFPTLVARHRADLHRAAGFNVVLAIVLVILTVDDTLRPWSGICCVAIVPVLAIAVMFVAHARRFVRLPAIVELLANTALIDAVYIDGSKARFYLRSDNRVTFHVPAIERAEVMQTLREHSPDVRFVDGVELPTAILRR